MIVRPTYRTVESAPAGFDLVQPKHDGQWCEVSITDGHALLLSRHGDVAAEWYTTTGVNATLAAEYLVGTQRARRSPDHGTLVVFDCVERNGVELFRAGYLDRLASALGVLQDLADDRFSLTTTHPISDMGALWSSFVLGEDGEGVVLRRSTATWSATLCRIKPAFERTESGRPRYNYRRAA